MKLVIRLIISLGVLFSLTNCGFITKEGIPSNLKLFLFGVQTDKTSPRVASIQPKDKSGSNFRNTGIFLVFNVDMNLTSVKENFSITSAGVVVEGEAILDGKVFSFIPKDNLASNTTFTVTAKAGTASKTSIGMSTVFTSTFTTGTEIDKTPPFVSSTTPADSATGYPINGTIVVNMNEIISPASFKSTMFTIINVAGQSNLVDSGISYNPDANLPKTTQIVARLNPGLKDLAGNTMTGTYTFVFTTGSSEAGKCIFGVALYGSCLLD